MVPEKKSRRKVAFPGEIFSFREMYIFFQGEKGIPKKEAISRFQCQAQKKWH